MDQLFEDTIDEIERFYQNHPTLEWGWRFLYGPKRSLKQSHGLITIGLNPGGTEPTTEAHRPNGNVYRDPEWSGDGPVYARQVHHLFRFIHENIYTSLDFDSFMNRMVTSNLVPFRGPGFDHIEPRQDILTFGRDLWTEWLTTLSPDIVLAIGNGESNPSPYRALKRIMSNTRQIEEGDRQPVWSNYTIKTFQTDQGETVVGLPHLSRCQFATSPKGTPAREFLIEELQSSNWNAK